MMVRDKSKKRFSEGEEDPMAGTSNRKKPFRSPHRM